MDERPKTISLAKWIAVLERMPVRIGDITPMGGGSYLVKFKYYSDKKGAWVSQMAPYLAEDNQGVLTKSEYSNLIAYIIALSASIEDYMSEETGSEREQ